MRAIWMTTLAVALSSGCGESIDRPETREPGELPDPSEGGNTRYDRTDPDMGGPGTSVGPSAAPPPGSAPQAPEGVAGGTGALDVGSPSGGQGTGAGVSAGSKDRDPQVPVEEAEKR